MKLIIVLFVGIKQKKKQGKNKQLTILKNGIVMNEKKYEYIKICLGYPKADDSRKIIWRKWNGVKTGKFETDLFGYKHVFAIDVAEWISENQFLAPNFIHGNILNLNLKKKYWEQIRDNKKHFEYREIKPYWESRLFNKK